MNFCDLLMAVEASFRRKVNENLRELKDIWREIEMTARSTFEETVVKRHNSYARRRNEEAFWKREYRKTVDENVLMKEKVDHLEKRLEKFQTDRRLKNEFIVNQNNTLLQQLYREQVMKIVLIDELLNYISANPNSENNPQQRKKMLKLLKGKCILKMEEINEISPIEITSLDLQNESIK